MGRIIEIFFKKLVTDPKLMKLMSWLEAASLTLVILAGKWHIPATVLWPTNEASDQEALHLKALWNSNQLHGSQYHFRK